MFFNFPSYALCCCCNEAHFPNLALIKASILFYSGLSPFIRIMLLACKKLLASYYLLTLLLVAQSFPRSSTPPGLTLSWLRL